MKIKSIAFKNYKAFFEKQTIQLKPITILIGKNSSGKSSIAKLFTLLENSLSGKINESVLLKNNGVELGGEFENLFFANKSGYTLDFSIEYEQKKLDVFLLANKSNYGLYIIKWNYQNKEQTLHLEEIDALNNRYIDKNTGEEYYCEFNGFCLTKLINNQGNDLAKNYQINNIDVDYIGPFRVLPDRVFHLSGKIQFNDTGITGENAYAMLGISQLNKTDLHEKVGEWYKNYFDGWELKVDMTAKPYIQLLLSKDNIDVNLVDVGQGMNQALPLIVRAHQKREHSIIVLEQPELHLHPAAHGDLMQLFAKSAKENNQTFIIETHSENMLLRLRRLIVEDTEFPFTKDDVVIYWVENAEHKGQELREITIDNEGVLSDWPDGVFNENLTEIMAIKKQLKRKK